MIGAPAEAGLRRRADVLEKLYLAGDFLHEQVEVAIGVDVGELRAG